MLTESVDHTINAGLRFPITTINEGQRHDWWMSPLIDNRLRVWIAHPNGTPSGSNNQPLPEGVTAYYDTPLGGIGFWGSPVIGDNYDQAYIDLCNWAYLQVEGTPGTFTTGTAGRSWVRSNGFWDNYGGVSTCNNNPAFALSPPNGINWS